MLQAGADLRAAAILSSAHRLLESRANGIEDVVGRNRFLTEIAAHREIARLSVALAR